MSSNGDLYSIFVQTQLPKMPMIHWGVEPSPSPSRPDTPVDGGNSFHFNGFRKSTMLARDDVIRLATWPATPPPPALGQ